MMVSDYGNLGWEMGNSGELLRMTIITRNLVISVDNMVK